MKIFLIFTLLFLNYSQAADESCSVVLKDKTLKLNDSEKLSLFDQEKSLSGFKVQDQDGGGTCYANSTSAVLQSIFPDQEISYQHAAITASVKNPSSPSKSQQFVMTNKNGDEDFTSGGFMCNTINNLKKNGGACPKKYSRLENGSVTDPYLQSRSMLGLGKYFDKVNSIKTDPVKFKQLKLEAAEIVKTTQKLFKQSSVACFAKKKAGELSLTIALQNNLAYKALDSLSVKNSKCSLAIIEEIKKLSIKSSIIKSDRVTLYPTQETIDKFQDILNPKTDPEFMSDLNVYVNGKVSREQRQKLASKLGQKINKAMSDLVPNDKFKDVCEINKDDDGNVIPPMSDWPDSIGYSFLRDIKNEHETPCDHFDLNNYEILMEDQHFSCAKILPIKQMITAMSPLIELGHALDDSLITGITEPFSKEATQLKNLLMPGCVDKSNLISLEGVKCSTKTMCDTVKSNLINNESYTGPAGSCYDLKTSKKIVREKVLKGIQQGNAFGFSTCTKFMSVAGFKSNHCLEPDSATGKHGYHEMALTGYRCSKGKIQYEVLNSWGSDYCPEIASDAKSGITCELKDGKNTGRFWVDEDIFVDNLQDLTTVSKDKK